MTAPTGGALTVNGTASNVPGSSSSISTASFTIGLRTDYAETLGAAASGLASSTLVRDQTTLAGTVSPGTTWTGATTLPAHPRRTRHPASSGADFATATG